MKNNIKEYNNYLLNKKYIAYLFLDNITNK